MVELVDGQIDDALGNDGNGGADAQANQSVVPAAAPSSSSSSAARQAHLASLKELQAKLDEQRRQTQSSSSEPHVARTSRRRRAMTRNASWPTTMSTNLRD